MRTVLVGVSAFVGIVVLSVVPASGKPYPLSAKPYPLSAKWEAGVSSGGLEIRLAHTQRGRLLVKGPSFRKAVTSTTRWRHVRPGKYRVIAKPTALSKVVAYPAKKRQVVRVKRGRLSIVRVDYPNHVSKRTEVLRASQIRSVEVRAPGSYRLRLTEPTTKGDILVLPRSRVLSNGALVRVTNVSGRTVSATTASLNEAIPRAEFGFTITESDDSQAQSSLAGARLQVDPDSLIPDEEKNNVKFQLPTKTLLPKAFSCHGNTYHAFDSGTSGVDLSLSVERFEAGVATGLRAYWDNANSWIRLTGVPYVYGTVKATGSTNVSCTAERDKPFTLDLGKGFIVQVGGLPVYIQPEVWVSPYVKAYGKISGSITADFNYTGKGVVTLDIGGVHPTYQHASHNIDPTPQLSETMTAGLEAAAKAGITFKVYDLGGPDFKVDTGPRFDGSYDLEQRRFSWNWGLHVSAGVGLRFQQCLVDDWVCYNWSDYVTLFDNGPDLFCPIETCSGTKEGVAPIQPPGPPDPQLGVQRISTTVTGGQVNGDSTGRPVWSPDGQMVAFTSYAPDLVPGDTNSAGDVFVKTLATGGVERVSTTAVGGQANSWSGSPVWSPDGSKLAFTSSAGNLVPGDTNSAGDVFVKTLATGGVERVSTTAVGGQANSWSGSPVWSPDGSKLAFTSGASNLVAGDTNNRKDVFVKSLSGGAVQRVSTTAAGGQAESTDPLGDAPSGSFDPVWSPDGQKIAFTSEAVNLVPGDTNNVTDVFVKALAAGTVQRVSTTDGGVQSDGYSDAAVWSPDGSRIAFISGASNLVAGDTNNRKDVFVKTLSGGAVQRVSTTATGGQADSWSYGPVWSPDGQKIAFTSYGSNLVPGDANAKADLFVKGLADGSVQMIAPHTHSGDPFDLSNVPAWSPDGQKIAFSSYAPDLVPGDTNGRADVFVKGLP